MAATIFFCAAILAWGVPRTFDAMNPPATPFAAAVAGLGTAADAPVGTAAGASATPAPEATAAPEATPAPGNLASPSATADAGGATALPVRPTAAAPAPSPSPSLSNAQQIALQQQLEQRGKAYVKALQAQDTAAIASMLAARCAGTDVSALIARRRAEISSAAGVPIDQLTALNQFVAHFDPFAGEAHTVLQLDDASGARVELPTADGWLLENGSWQSVNC